MEFFTVNQNADLVMRGGRSLGYDVEVKAIPNPTYAGLRDLGLQPNLMSEGGLSGIFRLLCKHRARSIATRSSGGLGGGRPAPRGQGAVGVEISALRAGLVLVGLKTADLSDRAWLRELARLRVVRSWGAFKYVGALRRAGLRQADRPLSRGRRGGVNLAAAYHGTWWGVKPPRGSESAEEASRYWLSP